MPARIRRLHRPIEHVAVAIECLRIRRSPRAASLLALLVAHLEPKGLAILAIQRRAKAYFVEVDGQRLERNAVEAAADGLGRRAVVCSGREAVPTSSAGCSGRRAAGVPTPAPRSGLIAPKFQRAPSSVGKPPYKLHSLAPCWVIGKPFPPIIVHPCTQRFIPSLYIQKAIGRMSVYGGKGGRSQRIDISLF